MVGLLSYDMTVMTSLRVCLEAVYIQLDSLAVALATECTDQCVCLVGLGHVSLVLTA
jgi:hypothetical protein